MTVYARVIQYVLDAMGEAVRAPEIAEALGVDSQHVRVALSQGVFAGDIEREARGLYVAKGLPDSIAAAVEAEGRVRVEGPIAFEGTPTGDGRMMDEGSLSWNSGPWALIWDRADGDHTGMTVGSITDIERRDDGVIWGVGYLSSSEDSETMAAVTRVAELFDEGAVGVSVALDSVSVDLRLKEGAEPFMVEEDGEEPELETDDEGRTIVARFSHDDMLEVTTSGSIRHVAVVDTAAFESAKLGIAAAAGLVACPATAGDPSWFADPAFGAPEDDERLRFDPNRGLWSAPFTVEADGRIWGHLAADNVCLVGRQGCTMPPEGLNAFMRFKSPSAGGLQTGPIVLNTGHSNANSVAASNEHLANTGRAVADVRVGRDRYGAWIAGAVRPGVSAEDWATLASSGVSGEWVPVNGKLELCAIVAVNAEGFPKGYMSYAEVQSQGIAASATTSQSCAACEDEDCGCEDAANVSLTAETIVSGDEDRLVRLEGMMAEMYAAHLLNT